MMHVTLYEVPVIVLAYKIFMNSDNLFDEMRAGNLQSGGNAVCSRSFSHFCWTPV